MLSLLGGLLFRTRLFVEHIVQKPNEEQASRLGFFLIVLLMINLAFQLGFTEGLYQQMIEVGLTDIIIWAIVFFLAPLQYFLQRFVFLISARLGLLMFAKKEMPRDPYERNEKFKRVKLLFPYVMYPSVFFSFIASPLTGTVIGFILSVMGLVYMFTITVHGLHKIYGVSPTVAFWGPLAVHFLLIFALSILIVVVMLILVLTGVVPTESLIVPQ